MICFYHDVNLAQLLPALPLFGSKKIYNFPLGSMNKGGTVMDESVKCRKEDRTGSEWGD